jgi:hypothetical protein
VVVVSEGIDHDARLAILRDICNQEGHGQLDEWTTLGEVNRRYSCRRGCGIAIFELRRSMTPAELAEWLARRGYEGEVRVRGTIEVTP